MKKIILLILISFYLVSCSDFGKITSLEEQSQIMNNTSISSAEQAVIDEGYSNPRVDGSSFIGCAEDDSMLTSKVIYATNINGKEVKLRVCCGLLFKSCTVRHINNF